jgi:hypothetical protein
LTEGPLMKAKLTLFMIAVFCGQSGCAVWTLPVAEVKVQHDDPPREAPLPVTSPMLGMVPGDVNQITTGQYAQLWISEPDGGRPPTGEPRSMAGRVLEMNADEFVLSDCVSFEAPVVQRRQQLLQKIPFYGRLFKMTGVGVTPTPIPGDVRLVRSSVLGACEIPSSEWEWFRQQPHFARIGVDFDLNKIQDGLR